MVANVGEMFYYGQVPWHGEGMALGKPATLEEALRAGGLNWDVGTAIGFLDWGRTKPTCRDDNSKLAEKGFRFGLEAPFWARKRPSKKRLIGNNRTIRIVEDYVSTLETVH